MKKSIALILLAALLLSACGKSLTAQIYENVEFAASPYKHINNGGVKDDAVLPYNIDAISGATMTVEGPAVVTSIPLSVRELENRNEGLVRGTYADKKGMFIYEGLDLYYLLYSMVEGDNGIHLTDTAYEVVLKNSNRADISRFTLADVKAAHDDGRPIILAYGMGNAKGVTAPFVFDAKNEGEHSLGYKEELGNDDGCIKLVYDADRYGKNDYPEFSNVAYIYVCEEKEPGFKHSESGDELFTSSLYEDYIVTFRGEALGKEIDLTVRELEDLVKYGDDGKPAEGGLGYSDWYSLANNAYWYVNEYEGLDLYKLLVYLGMDDAETMGTKGARTTLVSLVAADGALSSETFSVDALSYPDAFGFYNKNAADTGDGSYTPTNADLVRTGFPVLMAYGVNNYPYTINKTDAAYVSGLSNSGGPFRVVFGKTQYNHANGSNQVQYLSEVIAGRDVLYNTHKYTSDAALNALADDSVTITVNAPDGSVLASGSMTVGEIEDIIFGEDVPGNIRRTARVKNHFESNGTSDIYEGVDLEYLLMNVLGIPGTNGTVTFSNAEDSLSVTMSELFTAGYNTVLNRSGIKSVLAFAKNGSPLAYNESSAGYIKSIPLKPYLESDPAEYNVNNAGGPLCVMIPSSGTDSCSAQALFNVTDITVDLVPDSYAHITAPFDSLKAESVRFFGEGLDSERVYTVEELESRQNLTHTSDYSFLSKAGAASQQRYRGISVFDLFTEIGIKNNAGDVTVYAQDGSSAVFSLSQLKKAAPNWQDADKPEVSAMLAYGTGMTDGNLMEGCPLVADDSAEGYSAKFGNAGGPLKLIVPQRSADEVNTSMCIRGVTAIEVSANDVDTWSHSMSDVYEEFLSSPFTFTVKNDSSEWSREFTVAELESLKGIIFRGRYTVLDVGECEGIDAWKFIKTFAGDVPGIDDPISIAFYADDGYKNDVLSVVYKEGFEKGIATDTGERLPVLICYAINGYPVVDSENHAGYTGLAGNSSGPLRVIVEGTQGASVKYCVKLVVTVPGDGPIDISIDSAVFEGA